MPCEKALFVRVQSNHQAPSRLRIKFLSSRHLLPPSFSFPPRLVSTWHHWPSPFCSEYNLRPLSPNTMYFQLGYFVISLFRASFHVPWDFEIAGFDCIRIPPRSKRVTQGRNHAEKLLSREHASINSRETVEELQTRPLPLLGDIGSSQWPRYPKSWPARTENWRRCSLLMCAGGFPSSFRQPRRGGVEDNATRSGRGSMEPR